MSSSEHENAAQQCAVRHGEGPVRVLAGPGSGKTYTIVKRIRYLIEVLMIPPDHILVITFTKAAAREMQSRFLTAIGRSSSAVHFGTFHSIYYQILSRSGYLRDVSLITETEKRKLIGAVLRQVHPGCDFGWAEHVEILHEISRLKNKEDETGQFERMPDIYDGYCALLREAGKIDFDDMILYCYEMLYENKALCKEWQAFFTHILVDEFQDINRLQYQVLKLLAAPHNHLFAVGDDDQSIYGFRGAKPAVMKEFLHDYPGCRQVVLDINYRSTQQVVEASGKVIKCNLSRIEKKYRALRDGGGVVLKVFTNREAEDGFLLEQLGNLPDHLKQECAVILRTNHEVSMLTAQCREYGISVATSEKQTDIFSHFIGTDIMDYMRFACVERSRRHYLNIMNKPMRYITRNAVADQPGEIREMELREYYRDNMEMQNEIRRFFADCDRINRMSPCLAIHYIRKGIGYDRYLKERARPGEYESWTEIADALQKSAEPCRTADEWLRRAEDGRQKTKRSASSESQTDRSERSGVKIMTMHSSKGLEFHSVFLPHLNEGNLPGKRVRTTGQLEEERRLFYVAMTRAKEHLYLLYTDSSQNRPSRFLEPLSYLLKP